MSYDNTNRGSIWKNDEKRDDRDPDFRGSLNVAGVDYWVSAWRRKDGANPKAPALTFTVKAKEAVPRRKNDPISTGRQLYNDDMNDEIGF